LVLPLLLAGCVVYDPGAPPAYYAPPPAYYAPQPYYAPPPASFGFYFGDGPRYHHRHWR